MSKLNHKNNWNDAHPEKHCIYIIIVFRCMCRIEKEEKMQHTFKTSKQAYLHNLDKDRSKT